MIIRGPNAGSLGYVPAKCQSIPFRGEELRISSCNVQQVLEGRSNTDEASRGEGIWCLCMSTYMLLFPTNTNFRYRGIMHIFYT